MCGKSRPYRDSIPDRPTRSQSLHWLSYRAHKMVTIKIKNTVNLFVLLGGTFKNETKIRENIKSSKLNHDSNTLAKQTSTKDTNNPTHDRIWRRKYNLTYNSLYVDVTAICGIRTELTTEYTLNHYDFPSIQFTCLTTYFPTLRSSYGDRGSSVDKALCYKSEGRWLDPSWCHWNFSLTKSFRLHCGPGVDSASNRNDYQEHFLGVKAAGA